MKQLNEDLFDDFIIEVPNVETTVPTVEVEPLSGPVAGPDVGLANEILALLTDENEAIQGYNNFKADIGNRQDFIKIVDDIVAEEYNHIGMLQTMLKEISPNTETIEQGKAEAEQELAENVNTASNKKVLKEGYEAPYFKAFITNLGKYNEGELVGKWIEFPIDEDEFEDELTHLGIGEPGYDEWFVTDYDCNVDSFDWQELGEYPSYEKLQDFGQMLNDIDNMDFVSAVMEAGGYSLQEAIEIIDRGNAFFYPEVSDYTDLAYAIIDEGGGIESVSKDTIETYFDYEALGRDLSFDTYEGERDGEEVDDLNAGEYFCGDEDATDEEIGEAYVADVGIDGVGDAENYFDYDAFGRDLVLGDNYTITSKGAVWIA